MRVPGGTALATPAGLDRDAATEPCGTVPLAAAVTTPAGVPHLDDDPAPREACGVFGIYGRDVDVARITYFGLYALQHRGQESAGIATSDGDQLRFYKAMGLV